MPTTQAAAITGALATLTFWLFSLAIGRHEERCRQLEAEYEERCRQLKAEYERREAALIEVTMLLTATTQPLPRLRLLP